MKKGNPFAKYAFCGSSSGDMSEQSFRERKRSRSPRATVHALDTDTSSDGTPAGTPRQRRENTAQPVPLTKSSIVKLKRQDEVDDDDDDLLALGGQPRAAAAVDEPSPAVAIVPSTSHQSTVVVLSHVQWASAACRESVLDGFAQQFGFTLSNSKAILKAFRPFARAKSLAKILSMAPTSSVFGDAPPLPAETRCIDGLSLRSYQRDGVQFLLDSFHRGVSVILGDDMGLGKTAQICTFLHCLLLLHKIPGPHLLIVPFTTIATWMRELAKWAPELHVVKYHGSEASRRQAQMDRHRKNHVFITTSMTFQNDKSFFRKKTWVSVVVDEAHVLKGERTAISTYVRTLRSCMRIAVTGTPIHNRVEEVWSIVNFLYPNIGVEYTSAKKCDEEEDSVDEDDDQDALMGIVSPNAAVAPCSEGRRRSVDACVALLRIIMLRRTKDTLDLGIPPRMDAPTIRLEATPIQRTLFDMLTAAALDESSDSAAMFAFLTRQRHLCNHPLVLKLLLDPVARNSAVAAMQTDDDRHQYKAALRLKACGIPMDEDHIVKPSAKMIHLDQMLSVLLREGHRVLIFSNFTSTLDFLEALCVMRGYGYERLDGDTSRVERELSMTRFNNPKSSSLVFLLTTTAGGVGITLTGADTVVLFDAHYNPQLDRQAADRAHRLGQTKPVTVYRMCVADSVEEQIQRIALEKARLGDSIVEGSGTSPTMKNPSHQAKLFSADEIRKMFEKFSSKPNGHVATDHDNALVDDLVALAKSFMDVDTEASPSGSFLPRGAFPSAKREPMPHTHVCFCCGDKMRPLEPLLHCVLCTKAYHRGCVEGGSGSEKAWTCPRHSCERCGKDQKADGAIFCCTSCPSAFCFDCLDPRYLSLTDDGSRLANISHVYPTMVAEGMPFRKSMYYLSCLECSGLASDGESDATGSESTADYESDDSKSE